MKPTREVVTTMEAAMPRRSPDVTDTVREEADG